MMQDHNLSYRQLKCMAIVEGIGAGVFTIPALAVNGSRSLGLWPMLVSGVFLFLYGAYIWWIHQKMGKKAFPSWIQKIFLLRFWFNAFALAWFFCHSMQEIYMPKQSRLQIAFPALLVLWIVSRTTLQKRGRFLELIFPWTIAAFLGVILLAVMGSFSDWGEIPLLESPKAAINNGYEIFLFATPLEFLWLQIPALVNNLWGEKEEMVKDNNGIQREKSSLLMILFIIFLGNILLWFVTLQTLGAAGTVQTPWPVAKMMQLLQFPGGSVERSDLLLVIFWIFCVMAVISGYLFYGTWIQPHKTGYVLLGFFLLFFFLGEKEIQNTLFWIKKWIDVPLLLGLPLIALWQSSEKDKRKSARTGMLFLLGILGITFLNTGCEKISDIEEKNYVLSLYVDLEETSKETFLYHVAVADLTSMEDKNKEIPCKILTQRAKNLQELEKKVGENISGDMEWNHVYTIFFSTRLEKQKEKWIEFLKEWDAGWQYAPDVNVVVTPAAPEKIYGLKGITKASVGQEVALFQEKKEFKDRFLTPMKILRALSEGEKNIYFPYVIIKNGRIKMGG